MKSEEELYQFAYLLCLSFCPDGLPQGRGFPQRGGKKKRAERREGGKVQRKKGKKNSETHRVRDKEPRD